MFDNDNDNKEYKKLNIKMNIFLINSKIDDIPVSALPKLSAINFGAK